MHRMTTTLEIMARPWEYACDEIDINNSIRVALQQRSAESARSTHMGSCEGGSEKGTTFELSHVLPIDHLITVPFFELVPF